jgi:hypothetical protein
MTINVSQVDTIHVSGTATPWIPFMPVNDKIFIKYFRIDPFRGEIAMLLRSTAGQGLNIHRHTGIVLIYTTHGAWKYEPHGSVSSTGDFMIEPAGSKHSLIPLGNGDVEAFIVLQGELQFVNPAGHVVHSEDWRTSLERYRKYCAANGIAEAPLVSSPV